MNLKQKNDSNCNLYYFSLLVPCPNNFLVVCLCILIFHGIVNLNFFLSCSQGRSVGRSNALGRSVLGDTKNFHKAINGQSCKPKNSWRQNYLFHVCMLFFLTFSWGFSAWEFFVYSSVHSKVQENVYYYLEITLFRCKYSLIWVLNKSMLFGSSSLKVSLLLDMNSEKTFYYYSLIWKELSSENVSIAWYKLCSIVYQWLSENVNIVCCLEKCVVLFVSNSLQVSVLFDIKSETCFLLLAVIVWKCEYFLIFFGQMFRYCMLWVLLHVFLTIRMALIKRQSGLYLIFLKFFPATLPSLISDWKELDSLTAEFLWFI